MFYQGPKFATYIWLWIIHKFVLNMYFSPSYPMHYAVGESGLSYLNEGNSTCLKEATVQVFILSSKRSSGIQNHLLGWVLFTPTRKEKSTSHWFKAFEMSFSVTQIWWSVLLCLRRGRSVESEVQRDGGYSSAIPRVASAAETDLTQMKRVTRKGYGNKTRKTDGKKTIQRLEQTYPTQHC